MASELTPASTASTNDRHRAVIGAWLASLRSENTRTAYRGNVATFVAWLDAHRLDLLAVERQHVDLYRLELEEHGTPATVARKLSAISSLYKYLAGEGLAALNPVANINRPTVSADHSSTQGLTVAQGKQLLAQAEQHSPRAHALVSLLLHTGIRISEALNATTADLGHDAGHRVLTVTRKGGAKQKIVLTAPVLRALEAYLGHGVAQGQEISTGADQGTGTPLFTTRTGKPWARSEAFRAIEKLAADAGIPGRISPHSLRHTFATVALDHDVPLHVLQDNLGHADPRTTRRYDRARHNLDKSAAHVLAQVFN